MIAAAGGFWGSGVALVAVSVVVVLSLTTSVLLLMKPRSGGLRSRVAPFVRIEAPDGAVPAPEAGQGLLARLEETFGGSRWWQSLEDALELASIERPVAQIVGVTAGAMIVAAAGVTVVSGSLLLGALALLLPAGGLVALKQKLSGRRQEFGEQLTDSLQVLASAIRAGQSMAGALAVVVGESAEPTRTEFRRIVADEQLGVPLDEAIRSVAERMKSRDLEQVALVAAIQREAGGNTAEVLDQVIGTIRERAELRRKIRALTAQGRMSRWIVSLLPLALLLVLMLLSPGYLDPLFHTTTGQILLGVGGLLTVAGSFVIGRIVNIEV